MSTPSVGPNPKNPSLRTYSKKTKKPSVQPSATPVSGKPGTPLTSRAATFWKAKKDDRSVKNTSQERLTEVDIPGVTYRKNKERHELLKNIKEKTKNLSPGLKGQVETLVKRNTEDMIAELKKPKADRAAIYEKYNEKISEEKLKEFTEKTS